MSANRRWILAALAVALAVFVILLAMGRPPLCACGTVKLWHGVVQSAENSQHLADWYSFSHVIHGFLFHGLGWLVLRRASLAARLTLAMVIEGAWEILENTPMIINRYREVTMAWGYAGDSIVNSIADLGWMVVGFLVASRVRPRWIVLTAIAFELLTLTMIRDNLTLNVVMLVAPIESIADWQAGG